MELWDNYGITSYNAGRYGHYMAGMYYALEDALKYTIPELVVINALNIEGEVKARTDDKSIQNEFLFKYILYHNRWEELGMDDFQVPHSVERGAVTRTEIAEPIPYQRISRDQVCAENTVGAEYLKKWLICVLFGI